MTLPFMIGVLGSPVSWYMRDLVRAAGETSGVQIIPLAFDRLQAASLERSSVSSALAMESHEPSKPTESMPLDALDAVLVRTMPLGSLEQVIFRMNALHVAEQLGVPILNGPRCLEICIDKWLTIQRARHVGLLTPKTICCQGREEAIEAWHQLGEDCVVKPIFGGEGRGIVRVTDYDMAWRVFSTLSQIQAVMYVQEFLPNEGYDLRLLVLDDELFCVRRHGNGNWRANVSQGGEAKRFEPTFEQAEIAYRAARAVGGWMVGVDLIETLDGRTMLIEVNAVPGWRATGAAVEQDIAMRLIQKLRDR
ncbi:Alpha-aminoadipate--LysW ligase LysX [Pirellula sp. SH-Sr6A]|uniref:ATP-grasp domain-containing protein n=1 Tax=Pirellula sp. SH-Sr6A TaxID=1632865 RepID=UPI00078E93A6|nr:RimK family alpha-L-glutamate ligase [Pirellula sp. SH-Sr6A]AMV33326.1 Alpha-aminoadipate--LysW ligase LysX [Pirellula sp. SH-Sr6A]